MDSHVHVFDSVDSWICIIVAWCLAYVSFAILLNGVY